MIVSALYSNRIPTSGEGGTIRLSQERPPSEPLTIAQVAAVIDGLSSVSDQCSNSRGAGAYDASPPAGSSFREHQQNYLRGKLGTSDAFNRLAGQFGSRCLAVTGGVVEVVVYVFWSSEAIAEEYKLICPVARIGRPVRVRSVIRLKIDVVNSEFVDFGYFVVKKIGRPSIDFFWIGDVVVDQYGRAKSGVDLLWDGGTKFYFNEQVSGAIFAEFETEYDEVDVSLPGIFTGKNRDYAATVTALWSGSPVDLALDVPEPEKQEGCSGGVLNRSPLEDLTVPKIGSGIGGGGGGGGDVEIGGGGDVERDCTRKVFHELLHPCSGIVVKSWVDNIPSACDEDGNNPVANTLRSYIGAGHPDFEDGRDCDDDCTVAGYMENCCTQPPNPRFVPQCLSYRSRNRGGYLPEGGIEYIKNTFGRKSVVQFVYPEGEDCGERVDKLVIKKCEICSVADPVVYSPINPTVAPENGIVSVLVSGNAYPFYVTVLGIGFSTDKGTIYTNEIVIHASNSCGECCVTVIDSCGNKTVGYLNSTVGSWVLIYDNMPGYDGGVVQECYVTTPSCGDTYGEYREEGWCVPPDCEGDEVPLSLLSKCDRPEGIYGFSGGCPGVGSPPYYQNVGTTCHTSIAEARAACEASPLDRVPCTFSQFIDTELNEYGIPEGMYGYITYGQFDPDSDFKLFLVPDSYLRRLRIHEFQC